MNGARTSPIPKLSFCFLNSPFNVNWVWSRQSSVSSKYNCTLLSSIFWSQSHSLKNLKVSFTGTLSYREMTSYDTSLSVRRRFLSFSLSISSVSS
jgi:hypothetical protein